MVEELSRALGHAYPPNLLHETPFLCHPARMKVSEHTAVLDLQSVCLLAWQSLYCHSEKDDGEK